MYPHTKFEASPQITYTYALRAEARGQGHSDLEAVGDHWRPKMCPHT